MFYIANLHSDRNKVKRKKCGFSNLLISVCVEMLLFYDIDT